MNLLIVLAVLAIAAMIVWGSLSFWAEGTYQRNHPERTLRGCTGDDDGDR
ncbi:hypothetical protein OG203_41795 [Nocardia sp. NBC_01499]